MGIAHKHFLAFNVTDKIQPLLMLKQLKGRVNQGVALADLFAGIDLDIEARSTPELHRGVGLMIEGPDDMALTLGIVPRLLNPVDDLPFEPR